MTRKKVKRPEHLKWKRVEIIKKERVERLKEMYQTETREKIEQEFPEATWQQIVGLMKRGKVLRPKHLKYREHHLLTIPQEKAFVRIFTKASTIEDVLDAFPNLTRTQIRRKAQALGIKKETTFFRRPKVVKNPNNFGFIGMTELLSYMRGRGGE